MKKILMISALLLTLTTYRSQAQVSVNINIGNQPVWGPVGYDYVDYYYMPDIDVYYYVPQHQFVYYDMGRWIFSNSLPARYGSYDLYGGYKVVINERNPWLRHDYYHRLYSTYRGRHQSIIRDSRDPRYFVIHDHPEHNRYYGNRNNTRTDYNRNNANTRNNNNRVIENNRSNANTGNNDHRESNNNNNHKETKNNKPNWPNGGWKGHH